MKCHWMHLSLLFATVTSVFLLASLYSFVFDVEYNKCEMTYMMQYPEYVPVKLPRLVQRKFPQYGLYVYTEGHSEPVSRGVYDGIPLLFIPGNDGSHKQVRSLASVAIQMRKSLRAETRFDCFAVDLNSEFSALHGPFLYRQSEFVQHVVDHIESLYPSRARFSIVLVGHSMGGLVARHAMTLDGFDRGRVPLIVTLATPHQKPVLNTDGQMSKFYAEMNNYWRSHQATTLGHVALVSIGGGDRDIEVALGLTRLDGLAMPRNSLWASASHVRDAWASTDHRCIVWCKQLVIALCRALFTVSADGGFSGGGGSGGGAAIAAEFQRRLFPSTPSRSLLSPQRLSTLPQAGDPASWFYRDLSDPRQRSFRFERDRLSRPIFVKISAPTGGQLLAPGESAVFLLDGSDGIGGDAGWLFACLDPPPPRQPAEQQRSETPGNAGSAAPCSAMTRLDAAYGRDLPPSGLRRRLARVEANAEAGGVWRKATAFVVVLGPANEQTELHFDLRSSASRSLRLDARPWTGWLGGDGLRLASGSLYFAARLTPPAGLTGRGLEVALAAHNCHALVGTPGSLIQEVAAAGGYAHSVQYFNQNASLALSDCGGGGGDCRLHVIVNPLCEHTLTVRHRPHQFGAALLREAGCCLPTWTGLLILSALLSSLIPRRPHQHQKSLLSCLIGTPIPLLTVAVACLPASLDGGGGGGLGGLIRQLCTASLVLPLAAALLLLVAAVSAWLSLLMRGPRLLLPAGAAAGPSKFADFLAPFGCILALCLTQWHCAAAGVVFLLITQMLKTAACRLNNSASPRDTANDAQTAAGDARQQQPRAAVSATAEADAAASILAHHSALAAVCALLACLLGPSLFVWAKTLQQQQQAVFATAPLPVADPHYMLGTAFAILYAVDSALLITAANGSRWRFYAPPLKLNWPSAVCVSVLIGSVTSQSHGNYAAQGYLILLLFLGYTLARCVRARFIGTESVATSAARPKAD